MSSEGDEQELELCRVCANPFESCTMFRLFDDDDEDAELADIFRLVSGIEDREVDLKLPESCCQGCKQRLHEVVDLRDLCQESDRKLRKIIDGSDAGTILKLEILQLSQSCWEDSGIVAGSDDEQNEMVHIEEESEELIPNETNTEYIDNENAEESNVLLNLEDEVMRIEPEYDNSEHETIIEKPKSTTKRKESESESKPKKRGRKPKHLVSEPNNDGLKKTTKRKLPKTYQCASCGRTFKSLHSLKEHETTHSPEKAWKCHICPKEFARRDYYKRHINMHETEGQFKCNECDKAYHADKLLQEHIRIKHVGDRPFKCKLCPNAAYARASSLYAHVKINHEKKQPFKCDICLRTFYSKNCLERHQNRHKGIKTSQCPHCAKRYESNNYLQQHIAQRHPERAHDLPQCQYCGAPYSADSHYRKHVAAKHPEHFEAFELWLKAKRKAMGPAWRRLISKS